MDPLTPVVVAARRTPVAGVGRGLAGVDAASLGAAVLAAVRLDLASLVPGAAVDDVLLGNCCGPGGDVARSAVLAAGLGIGVPAVTVDRQCGAGLEAVRIAAALVRSGEADVVLAGGTESASTAPWRFERPREAGGMPRPYDRAPFAPAGFADPDMGEAADAVARAGGVARGRQDAYAARSHALALAAARSGVFDAELVPVAGVTADDRPRRITEATLARFHPAFGVGGTATAGNSCGISDGAAALAIVPERTRARLGLRGLRILATAVRGVDPALPALATAPVVRAVLARAAVPVSLSDVGVLEITEAFAAQVLACTDALGLDPFARTGTRVCPQGGAIALGHPWGASGALLMVRLFSSLVRAEPVAQGPLYGVATCAIGGGQAVAVLVEAVASSGDEASGEASGDEAAR